MTNREVIAAWEEHARTRPAFGPQGDHAREHILNPVLFELLGPPARRPQPGTAKAVLEVLDAGCGGGYLCRLLARAGAHVTGIEPAPTYIGRARARRHGCRRPCWKHSPSRSASTTCKGISPSRSPVLSTR